jgi:putative peptide zinc metalloprotease protein
VPLPPLREELALLPGPTLADGQPSWTLHDPSRNRFFSLDWPTLEILQRWPLDDAGAIVDEIGATTTLQLEAEDVEQVARFLVDNQLTRPPSVAPASTRSAWPAWRAAASSGCCTTTCSSASRCSGRTPG